MMIETDEHGAILTGQLSSIPVLPLNTVKIFVCANPGEFDVERKYLWHEILPDLQSHCVQYGIDVIFVDLLLGNHTDSTCTVVDLSTRIREIDICHEESIGPFFLAFLGDQYGSVSLPAAIDEVEFNQFCEAATKLGKKVDILRKWYQLDKNAIQKEFILSERLQKMRGSDANLSSIYDELLDIIQSAAAYYDTHDRPNNNKSSERYFVSGLESQIKQALWLSAENSIFVFRSFETPDKSSTLLKNGNFSKLSKKQNGNRLTKLKENIQSKTDESNIINISVNAQEEQYAHGQRNYDEYIENFTESVASKLNEVFCKNLIQTGTDDVNNAFDYKEPLVHLQHCAKIFNDIPKTGFEKHLSKLQTLLINGARVDHQLTLIKTLEGCGKSSIVAKMCYRARELFGKEAILIPIFIGLTAKSCLIEDIFRRICSQITIVLNQQLNIESYSMKKLINYFHGLMNRVSKSSTHLLVFVDGLERLQTNLDNFESIDWLITKLPPKFHIIATCTASVNLPIVKRLESKLLTTDVIVFVGTMSDEECNTLLNQTLLKARRKLTDEQHAIVLKAIGKERCPLIVNVASKMVTKWSSGLKPNQKEDISKLIPTSFGTLVDYVTTSVETSFGLTVTSALCSYITLARYGLTEAELLDVMSANDDVLLSLYTDETPVVLRFPCHVWVDIRQMLNPVLCKRYVSGKVLFTWVNRSCMLAMRQKYLTNAGDTLRLHRNLSDIFLEQWDTNSPFVKLDDSGLIPEDFDRLLCPQPLVYSDVMYNKRKLQELWFHLLKSGDIDTFKKHTFCNFEYLLAMVDADSIQKAMYNIELIKPMLVDTDIHMLDMTLKAAGMALHMSTIQLANELIGRLRQIKDYFPQYIDSLVIQCMEWCDSFNHPLLVPLTTWLDNVHRPYVTSMTYDGTITSAALMPNGQHVLLASGNSISMYHIASKRMVKSFNGHNSHVTCLYLDGKAWRLISGAKDKTLCIWDLNSETCMQTIRDFKTYVTCLTCLKDEHVICGTQDGSVVVRAQSDGRVVKTMGKHTKKVTAVRLCKSNTILISGSLDCNIVLWYTADWTQINVINNEVLSPILCVDVSIDSTFLIAGCDNGSLHVIALATGSIAQKIQGHKGNINSVSICDDCHHCVAASSCGDVYFYNFRTTEVLDVFKRHKSEVMVTMFPENQQLAVTTSKHDMCVWSLLKRYTKETYHDVHSGHVSSLAVTADNKRLISGSFDGFLKTWNLDISDFADNFIGHTGPVMCLAIASDNSFVVSGSSDMTLKVWSLITASIITNYKGHDQAVSGVYVLSDNRLVLSMDASQKIHMWRAEDAQTIRLYAGPTVIHSLPHNSQFCVSGAGDNRLQIWKLSDGSVTKEISHTENITCLLCSRDSQYLVTGSIDRSVKVWELDTGKIVQIIVDHNSPVRCLAITDDNETILSAGDDGLLHVCSLSLGTVEKKMKGHFDSVTCLKLTSDDAIVVSGSLDHTVRVWNYRRGHQLTMFDTHYPVVNLVITNTADRIGVQLADNNHVPILCLHNTPSKQKPIIVIETASLPPSINSRRTSPRIDTSITESQVDLSDFSSEGSHALPIKPKASVRPRVSAVIRIPSRRRRLSSVSSIPQIIQHSPIRAPIQSTMKAQEKRRLKFPLKKSTNKPKLKPEEVQTKRSNICSIL